jgi:drug/metabolite transporter (DMT)-like permease
VPIALGDVAALICAISWGGTSLMARAVSRELPPIWFNALRCLVGTLAVVAILPWTLSRSDLSTLTPVAVGLLLGSVVLGMGIGDTAFFASIRRLGVARAMPIASSYPLLTALIAVPTLGEAVTLPLVVGIIVVSLGVWLLTSDGSRAAAARHADFMPGVLLAVVASLGWALSSIFVRPALHTVDVILATTIRTPMAAALLLLVGYLRIARTPFPKLSRSAAFWMLISGIVTTFSASLFLLAVDLVGAARTAALSSASPLFVAPLAFVLFGERPSVRLVVGIAITVVGIVVVVAT